MYNAIAMGKVTAGGSIISATPGISVTPTILTGNMFGPTDIGYTVNLPDRLVDDNNYIVQLTAENYGEDGPDYVTTSIAIRNQFTSSFEVIIWADRVQTIGSPPCPKLATVHSTFHFVIYKV